MLAALQAGNRGTQACITAASAVSGIIADLDTTIMFATAGTLNRENSETFADHRYQDPSAPVCQRWGVRLCPVVSYLSELWTSSKESYKFRLRWLCFPFSLCIQKVESTVSVHPKDHVCV